MSDSSANTHLESEAVRQDEEETDKASEVAKTVMMNRHVSSGQSVHHIQGSGC